MVKSDHEMNIMHIPMTFSSFVSFMFDVSVQPSLVTGCVNLGEMS